jgi:N-acetylmuramoyl-L-alanine amidase
MTLAQCGVHILRAISSFIFLALLSLHPLLAGRWDTESAARAFEDALQKQSLIEHATQPDLSQYLECARTYRKVYMSDPHYLHSPDAVYGEGMLYEAMGNKFEDSQYYRTAAKRFKFLVEDYPGNRNCPEALRRLAAIYSGSLSDQEAAHEALQLLRAQYKDARTAIQLAQEDVDRITVPSPAAAPSPAVPETSTSAAALVRNIRSWSTSEYTRVTIDMDSEAQYSKARLSNPDRIYVDISRARLSEDLSNRTFAVGDQVLKQVRVGQNHPNVVRVVLDIETGGNYTVSELHDPFRIVIDFKHSSAAKTEPGIPPLASASRTEQAGQQASAGRTAVADRPAMVVHTPAEKPADDKHNPATSIPETGHASPPAAITGIPTASQDEAPPAQTVRVKDTAKVQTPAVDSRAANEIKPADTPSPGITPESRNDKAAAKLETKPPAEKKPDLDASPKAAALTSRGDRTMTRMLGLKVGTIVIDPGHGGHDLGTVGPGGLVEKDLVLSLAFDLKKLIEENMYGEVVLTRTDDSFVSLEERTAIANSHRADLFVSIHANSSRYRAISGVETYYLDFAKTASEREVANRENAAAESTVSDLEDLVKKIAQAEKSAESRELASQLQKSLYSGTRMLFPTAQNRGVRRAPFVVLIGANMPSVLAEVAFISNPKDERTLNKDANRQALAKAIFSGIESYIKTLGSNMAQNQRHPR